MSMSEEEILKLIDNKGYNDSSIVSKIESYVKDEISEKVKYNFKINRTLIKLYQNVHTNLYNENMIALVLMLSLLQYGGDNNNNDVLALCCLIPERIQCMEPNMSIIKCSEELDSCNFINFWKTYDTLQSNITGSDETSKLLSNLVTNSINKFRLSILNILSLSYKIAPLDIIKSSLNVKSDKELEDLKNSSNVIESISNKEVTFVSTSNNTKRDTVYHEGVNFNDISTMMFDKKISSIASVLAEQ